jgi:hypothetical protein
MRIIRRWIRLLFGREFPFEDLLALWDKLFAEDPDLELIDMICVSMLLRIRWQCKMAFGRMKSNEANGRQCSMPIILSRLHYC